MSNIPSGSNACINIFPNQIVLNKTCVTSDYDYLRIPLDIKRISILNKNPKITI